MFRMPGKEPNPAEKEAEKAKAKAQVRQQFLLFAGVVLALRAGKSQLEFLLLLLFHTIIP